MVKKKAKGNNAGWKLAGIWLAVALGTVGCAKDKADEDYKKVVDDYAKIILSADEDSAKFDKALKSAGAYLEQPGPETLEKTRKEIQESIREMEETKNSLESYTMDEDFSKLLTKTGIDPEEYLMNADSRGLDMDNYILDMNILDQYLALEEISDMSREAFEVQYQGMVDSQEIMREYSYCTVNYWFAEQGEDVEKYVKEQVLDKLTSFQAENPVWDTDRDAVERRMSMYMDKWEEVAGALAEHVGESQEKLYEAE